jgi:predicted acetyltransferase
MELVWPALEYLPSYVAALERDWSPNNMNPSTGREELALIAANPAKFIADQIDREGRGLPIELPDGSLVPRLPGYRRWIWDGEFCGSLSLRWQPGTTALPPHCLGHIGYAVVPWKRGRGYATRALALLLEDARGEGLEFVELTTAVSNTASCKVIEANGGLLIERFRLGPEYGGIEDFRFRIYLR